MVIVYSEGDARTNLGSTLIATSVQQEMLVHAATTSTSSCHNSDRAAGALVGNLGTMIVGKKGEIDRVAQYHATVKRDIEILQSDQAKVERNLEDLKSDLVVHDAELVAAKKSKATLASVFRASEVSLRNATEEFNEDTRRMSEIVVRILRTLDFGVDWVHLEVVGERNDAGSQQTRRRFLYKHTILLLIDMFKHPAPASKDVRGRRIPGFRSNGHTTTILYTGLTTKAVIRKVRDPNSNGWLYELHPLFLDRLPIRPRIFPA